MDSTDLIVDDSASILDDDEEEDSLLQSDSESGHDELSTQFTGVSATSSSLAGSAAPMSMTSPVSPILYDDDEDDDDDDEAFQGLRLQPASPPHIFHRTPPMSTLSTNSKSPSPRLTASTVRPVSSKPLRSSSIPSRLETGTATLKDQDDDDDTFSSICARKNNVPASPEPSRRKEPQDPSKRPALEPYVCHLERFELFSTNQCYYLVGCDKQNHAYRVLKMDRTLIEYPPEEADTHRQSSGDSSLNNETTAASVEATHTAKPTLRPLSDFLSEDPHTYTQDEIQDMLDMIHHGNTFGDVDEPGQPGAGLKPMAKGYGIVGFIRFLDCYYLTLITRRAKVGSIGGNGIYTIKNTETFPLKPSERVHLGGEGGQHAADPSSMLLSMWNRGKRSVGLGLTNREIAELRYQGLYQVVDFQKNFYFSYTYDLTRSLQENFLSTSSRPFPPPPFKDMYAWNYFLTRELEGCTTTLTTYHWVMPIIHGAFVQRKLHDYGRMLNLILIARRSRHFAGTRYLKRGVSEQGKVANDVEHEQMLHDEGASHTPGGAFSSFLQVRGSIPTYWTQESSVTMPKPPIELNRVDPTYRATQAHFEDLLKRYGSPIVVLDLVKQSEKREREVRVGNEFRHAIDYINTSIDDSRHAIRYCALDYSHISKHRHLDVSTSLNEVSTWSVNQTGFFCSSPSWKIVDGGNIVPFDDGDKKAARFLSRELGLPIFPMEQRGVLRTNCIDCLDRTNVAQFSAGVEALEQQLVVMGIRSSPKLDPSSTIIRVLIDMYVEIGDHVALQYGGSEAHKKVSSERSESNNIPGPIGKHKELLTSIRRYYSNAFTDRLKQDAMNLLLGYYIPYRHTIPLWEMETDYYLHNLHVKMGRGSFPTMRTYQRAFGVEWREDLADDALDIEYPSPTATSQHRRTKLEKIRSGRRGGSTSRLPSPSGFLRSRSSPDPFDLYESARIARVRRRCKAQNESLSLWWKVAIQSHLQQRMWMQLSQSPEEESLIPPRFERLYQPDRIAQFDRFFARAWATPVRRSHSAKQTESGTELADFRKSISGRPPEEPTDGKDDESEYESLSDYISTRGYDPQHEPSLKRFVEPHRSFNGASRGRDYVGQLTVDDRQPCEEFIKYAAPMSSISASHRKQAYEEFKACLHDTSLSSDDVDGIRNLAESAHISRRIRSGQYRGLHQSESAMEITTVLHEQFNALDGMSSRGDDVHGMAMVTEELRRRGYDTPGMKEAVSRGWAERQRTRQQYAELLGEVSVGCRRSDLTTPESMKLYASFFEDATELSKFDLTFMTGESQGVPPKASSSVAKPHEETKTEGTTFVEQASKVGYGILSRAEIAKSKPPPLFTWNETHHAPPGFEQINEDLFSLKDNKFMVFNHAGVASWHGTEPKTKLVELPKTDNPPSAAAVSAYIQQIL